MPSDYHFSGWATKNDLKCADGRTIRRDAFKDNNGQTVPLVWQHQHNDPANVLGHALLENRNEGVYFYGKFNDTESGRNAKSLVEHGDIKSVSIWANKLTQSSSGDVYHGDIKELSLVFAPANPGAQIEFPILAHGLEAEDRCIITSTEEFELYHAEEGKPVEEDTKKKAPAEEDDGGDETIQDVFNTLSEKQKKAVYYIIGSLTKGSSSSSSSDDDDDDDEAKHSEDYYGGDTMKYNVFDEGTKTQTKLSHDDMQVIFKDAKRLGSLRDAVIEHMENDNGVLAHAVYNHDDDGNETTVQTYGIADINYLFPDARNLNNTPDFIQREQSWVKTVMNSTHHSPFSRVKSMHADITMDEARALGYIKGNLKKEEVFSLLKRTTDPQTIYKKQKLDRDDIIDITDFDVVAWLKSEMRMMLDEEIARAILIGDGRSTASDDKISEDHIRPVATDSDLYTIKVSVTEGTEESDTAKAFIRQVIKSRKDYKGSGNPTLFTTEDWLTEMLLLEDNIGHMLYESEAQLATKLRVSKIVTVPVMEGFQIPVTVEGSTTNKDVLGVIVNLSDYNVGSDKGGAVAMFDDFDIDYNQQKYLIETRISGALTKPYSAITLYKA